MRMHLIPAKADATQELPPPAREEAIDPASYKTRKRRLTRTVLIILSVLVIALAIVVPPAVARVREYLHLLNCQMNFYQMPLMFNDYALDHEGMYPPLSPMKGDFSFIDEDIHPRYMRGASLLICPGDPEPPDRKDMKACMSDASYFYLGYEVTNETEARAFLDAYEKSFTSGIVSFECDLPVAPGTGTGGGDVIKRLKNMDDDPANPQTKMMYEARMRIPVMFERAGNHSLGRINVLYQDGKFEFVRMGEKFPAQQWFLDALEALEK